MNTRYFLGLAGLFLLLTAFGCGNSEPTSNTRSSTKPTQAGQSQPVGVDAKSLSGPAQEREQSTSGADPSMPASNAIPLADEKVAIPSEPGQVPSKESFKMFFPTSTGTQWTYRVQVTGEIRPLRYQEVTWSKGGHGVTHAIRGYVSFYAPPKNEIYQLKIRVKGPAASQGPFAYPAGVELEIVKDELSIFQNHERVFWAISESGRFLVLEVVEFAPGSLPGAPSSSEADKGHSSKLFMFSDKPMIEIGEGKDPAETLTFLDVTDQAPQNAGVPCVHYVRKVKPAERKAGSDPSNLDQGFSEDMWFAKGKGLVRLEQRIGKKTSMVWQLVSFSAPAQ